MISVFLQNYNVTPLVTYVDHGIINLICIVVVVDSRCVCGCVRLGVAGGSQYTTSCEPPCGLAILLGRPVPHQSREFVI